jgi:hypothetical protein
MLLTVSLTRARQCVTSSIEHVLLPNLQAQALEHLQGDDNDIEVC